MVKEKVCVNCKRFVVGDICPACKSTKFTRDWHGVVIVIDPDSEIAKALNINAPGKYAISIGSR
ncbi:MAG: DNA-directed RNA polymerase, subunit E'' [Candidatus Aenigmarchaeota archaeon]|nr:DNA-directed RNA polymerase, subunit E'' [Candidatus Aenigmarchaeota archaeon]